MLHYSFDNQGSEINKNDIFYVLIYCFLTFSQMFLHFDIRFYIDIYSVFKDKNKNFLF